MTRKAPGAWITLNTSYYIAPTGDPLHLLDDASLLLDGAQGITRSLGDMLDEANPINPADFANALWSIAMLIEMGQRSAQEANRRLAQVRERVWQEGSSGGG